MQVCDGAHVEVTLPQVCIVGSAGMRWSTCRGDITAGGLSFDHGGFNSDHYFLYQIIILASPNHFVDGFVCLSFRFFFFFLVFSKQGFSV